MTGFATAWIPRWIVAGSLLRELSEPARDEGEGVVEEPFEDRTGTPVRGTLFRPDARRPPYPALVLCHGAAEDGFEDERLVRLARALARRGFLVLAPDLEDLRRFRVSERTVERIVAAHRALLARADQARGGRAAFAGISFAGTLCLLAAREPAIRDRVPAVLSFGGYRDLEGLVRYWLTTVPEAPPGVYPLESYGKGIVILNNLDGLAAENEREALRRGLEAFLRDGAPPPRPAGLGDGGSRLWEAATTVGPVDPSLVEAILAASRPDLARLSPAGRLDGLRARVFLLHASGDPLIPPSESDALARDLRAAGSSPHLIVTSLFEHVSLRGESRGAGGTFSLVRFTARFLRAAGL